MAFNYDYYSLGFEGEQYRINPCKIKTEIAINAVGANAVPNLKDIYDLGVLIFNDNREHADLTPYIDSLTTPELLESICNYYRWVQDMRVKKN